MKKNELTLEQYSSNTFDLLIRSSLFLCLNNAFNNFFDFPEDCNLPSEVYELTDRVKKDFTNLHETLREDVANRLDITTYYTEAKTLIHSLAKSLLLYKLDIELLNEIIADNMIDSIYKDNEPLASDNDNNAVVNLCMYYLDKEKKSDEDGHSGCGCGGNCGCGSHDHEHEHSHEGCSCGGEHSHSHDDKSLLIANIMSSIKMRMTKDKFYDYIKNGLLLSSNSISSEFALFNIEMLISQFFPQSHDDYGTYFKNFETPLKALMEKDFKTDTKEQLTELLTILNEMNAKVTEFISLAFALNENCNAMLILFGYAKSFDHVINGDLILKDLYFSVKENINILDEDDDLFHKINNTLDENIESMIDELTENTEGIFESLMETPLENVDPSTLDLIESVENIRALYYESIDELEELFFCNYDEESDEEISLEDFTKLIDEELPSILDSIKHLPSSTQKIIRQAALKTVQSPFTEEEMLMYLKFSYSSCANQNEQQAYLHKLIRTLAISEEDLEQLGMADAFEDEYSFESYEDLSDRGEI